MRTSAFRKLSYSIVSLTFILFLLLGPMALIGWAQTGRTISGKVTDQEGEPLSNVTILATGSDASATTNAKGLYSIAIKKAGASELTFSFVGFEPRTVMVQEKLAIFNISLTSKSNDLEDVVVIGYGTEKRKDLTGSVASAKVADMQKAPVASFEDALAGRVSGVQVAGTDGQPGAGNTIVIRGGNSVTGTNSPLYVVDGFPIEGMNNNIINPSEIESIEVLKDASATAIYGARGANGVVLITTKKGKTGAPVVAYNTWYGIQKSINTMEMMDPYEFVKYQLELNSSIYSPIYLRNGKTLDSYKEETGTNWIGQVLRTAPMNDHFVSVSGGNDKTRYSLSGSIFNQDGIMINSGYKRYQGRFALTQTVSNFVTVGINANYTGSKTYGQIANSGSDVTNASTYLMFSALGYRPITGDAGNLLDDLIDPELSGSSTDLRVNPVLSARNTYNPSFNNTMVVNAYAEFKLLKNLKFKTSGGIIKTNINREIFNNSQTSSGSPLTLLGNINGVNGSVAFSERYNKLNENTLTYNKKTGDHSFNVVGGFTMQETQTSGYGYTSTMIPNEDLGIKGLGQGTLTVGNSTGSVNTLASFLGRVNYQYKSRYLFTASFRSDGSSKFKDGSRWGHFPSAAIAWKLAQEKFMENIPAISNATVRASYGVSGNNRIGDFDYAPTLNQTVKLNSGNSTPGYSFNNSYTIGAVPLNIGNPDLTWEKTAQIDIGLDLSLFNDRITFVFDYYQKKTTDLLLNASLPTSAGFEAGVRNIGAVNNKGIEFTLNTVNIKKKDFTWTTDFNIAFNKNTLVSLNEDEAALISRITNWNSSYNNAMPYIAKPGNSVAMYYGFLFDGLYQVEDFNISSANVYSLKTNVPNNGNARANIKPGHIKYKDINGDGVVDNNDLTFIGNPNPVHIGGITNNFTYKRFDLNIFFQWSYGNEILNANRLIFEGGEGRGHLNMYKSFANRWSMDTPENSLPTANGQGPNVYTDRVVEDGSFLRFKTLALGYSLPTGLLNKIKIKNIRFYVAAQNLFTITNYSGNDPDVSVRSSALTPGFDWSAYPRARTLTGGLNITF